MESISCFFFDVLFLGYVEDKATGLSFQIPGELGWKIYIEVRQGMPQLHNILYMYINKGSIILWRYW